MSTSELRRAVVSTTRIVATWPVAPLLGLVVNALDASESSGSVPALKVGIDPDALWVRNFGPGLPFEILERSLDYRLRVSDNAHYVSPTRGQLGNALKCFWAVPFVSGEASPTASYHRARHFWPVQQAVDGAQAAQKEAVTIPDDLVEWMTRTIQGTDRLRDVAVWARVQGQGYRQEAASGPNGSIGEEN